MANDTLESVFELMRGARLPPGTPLEMVRQSMVLGASIFPAEEGVTIEQCTGGPAGEWHLPEFADETAALLYLHGGGYVVGSPVTHRHLVSRLARAARLRTLVPDYRLAPEHPFPAGLEDAVAAYEHLLASGLRAASIAVAGDSAGGGLTLALALACKERGLPLPRVLLVFSPWVDMTISGESVHERAERDPLIRPEELTRYAAMYLNGAPANTPLASPLHADLSGLPPTFVYVGTEEVLFDDSERIVAAARQAGVRVHYSVSERMPHVWPFFAPVLPEACATLHEAGTLLRAMLSDDGG